MLSFISILTLILNLTLARSLGIIDGFLVWSFESTGGTDDIVLRIGIRIGIWIGGGRGRRIDMIRMVIGIVGWRLRLRLSLCLKCRIHAQIRIPVGCRGAMLWWIR